MNRRNAAKLIPLTTTGILNIGTRTARARTGKKPLCLRYLNKVGDMLVRLRETEADNLLEAAYRIASTIKNGGTCINQWDMGHNIEFDLFPNRQGDPGLFVNGYREDEAKSGDTLLLSIVPNWRPMNDPHEKGVFVIGAPAPWSAETPNPELLTPRNRALTYRHFCDLWIDTGISTHGAIMRIPGESVPMGPTSGVLGMMTLWMITADAVRILARDGVPVSVRGDEKTLGENAPYVSLHEPLGRKYFAETLKQIRNIEAELGTVNRIADMAVDTILAGGKIYNYSRYERSLCYESTYRRGGLLLNRGIRAGDRGPVGGGHFPDAKPTAKDMVIMGIFQPDDPLVLRDIKALRTLGLKIVSVGAKTRNGSVPDGDTIDALADLHLGNMCDTYGLFAIPGVARRVCPTSGLLLNQLFYTVQMQIAEKLIERTGNAPRIDANAAMIGGLEKRRRDLNIVRVRGY